MPCTTAWPSPTILMGAPWLPDFLITRRLSAIVPRTQMVSPGSADSIAVDMLTASVTTAVQPVGAGSGRIAPRPSGEVPATGPVGAAGGRTVGAEVPQPAAARPTHSNTAIRPARRPG